MFADSKDNEFPIDVYIDMFEEEDMDVDIGKKYGYFWEYMTFSENLIDSLYNKKVDSLNAVL